MLSRTGVAARGTGRVRIRDLDPRGRGVGRAGGKTTFVHGALPGEEVVCRRVKRRRNHDEAVVLEVVEPSPDRVEPRCRFYERCGGCSLQHLSGDAQLRHKERTLLAALSAAGDVAPGQVMSPLAGSPWRYRRKARLGARYVPGRFGALVGFRERLPNRVADMTDCEVLGGPLGPLVTPLRELVGSLEARARIPQIEVAAGDAAAVLVIRHLDPLSSGRPRGHRGVREPGTGSGCGCSRAGPTPPTRSSASESELHYTLDDGAIRLTFSPLDFVQVNAEVNRALVRRVVSMLAPAPGERVLDAYCGLGNFSLPLAARGAVVTGLEAAGEMVERARANAAANGLSGLVPPCGPRRRRDRAGLAGPRMAQAAPRSSEDRGRGGRRARRVWRGRRASCTSRATPTRSRATPRGSCTVHGYRLVRTGLVDMFPHTSHIESVSEFEA